MKKLAICAALFSLCGAIEPTVVHAQSYDDAARPRVPVTIEPESIDPRAVAGPTIYIVDKGGVLSTVQLGTYHVHRIGRLGAGVLTDIGFDPKTHALYGISFGSLYLIDKTTAATKLVGNLGISDANALVFGANDVAYVEGVNAAELYDVDVRTGHAKAIGSTAPYKSAGDLTFYDGALVLAGYKGTLESTTPDDLVEISTKTGKPYGLAALDLANLFALVSTGKNALYGFSEESLYELFPAQANVRNRVKLLKNLKSAGIEQIYGAAYDGYDQN